MSITRRDFALGSIVLPTRASALAQAGIGASEFTPAQPAIASKWMHDWMSANKTVDGTLWVSRFKDPIYFLLKPISWQPGNDEPYFYPAITVPVGFVTDFASIPQIFWSALRPDGDYAYAAVLHDFLYWDQSTTREIADDIFKLAMNEFGIGKREIFPIYHAVRLFGGAAWHGNEEAKRHGERRILKRFPDNPRVTWDQWKKKNGVFI